MAPVSSQRMAAADAQLLWLSAKVPNDQFLVYVFDGAARYPGCAPRGAEQRQRCDELRLRVCNDGRCRYPRWVRGEIDTAHRSCPSDQRLRGLAWMSAGGRSARPDRPPPNGVAVHVLPPSVVVMQVSHALGDGTRSAALAAALLGRRIPISAVTPDRREPGVAGAQRGPRLPRHGPAKPRQGCWNLRPLPVRRAASTPGRPGRRFCARCWWIGTGCAARR